MSAPVGLDGTDLYDSSIPAGDIESPAFLAPATREPKGSIMSRVSRCRSAHACGTQGARALALAYSLPCRNRDLPGVRVRVYADGTHNLGANRGRCSTAYVWGRGRIGVRSNHREPVVSSQSDTPVVSCCVAASNPNPTLNECIRSGTRGLPLRCRKG